MRQWVRSADVYCQNINNRKYTVVIFIQNGKKGQVCKTKERLRERESECEGIAQIEVASIIKWPLEERTILG
jgi:hypothetical protein